MTTCHKLKNSHSYFIAYWNSVNKIIYQNFYIQYNAYAYALCDIYEEQT